MDKLPEVAYLTREDLVILKTVINRLYGSTVLSYDERRDLAKKLDGVLCRAEPVAVSEPFPPEQKVIQLLKIKSHALDFFTVEDREEYDRLMALLPSFK